MDIFTKSLEEIHKDLVDTKISVEELVKASLDRIAKTDDEVKSFITVRELDDMQDEIARAQKMIDDKKAHTLTGIPYSAKDLIATKGIRSTASSKVLDQYRPQYNATVKNKLDEAGAIMVGKTNMDAFAHGSSTETSDYFPSHNPWDLKRNPGGSSGGAATSVASLQVPYAVGTETAGSIRQPAALCGITGMKGTYGRVSRYGIFAMGSSLDCPGPMTRTAKDAAIVLDLLSGQDKYDGTTIPEGSLNTNDLERKDLKGLKIGFCPEYMTENIEPGVSKAAQDAVKQLEDLGAEIIEVDLLNPDYAIGVYTILQRSEVSSNLARYQGTRYSSTKDAEIVTVYDYMKANRSIFGYEAKRRMMTGAYALSKGYYDEYYKKAQKVRTLFIENFREVFKKVDAFVAPTSPNIAPVIGKATENPLFGEMADRLISGSTISGLPGISIPVGFSEEMPVGMQVIAPSKEEKLVLEIANVYQQSTEWHKMTPYDK